MAFKTPRDSSNNNVPVVGYNHNAEAQDTLIFAPYQVTETVIAGTSGLITVSNNIIDISGTLNIEEEVARGRNYSSSISALAGSTPLFIGEVDNGKTFVAYTDTGLTTPVTSGTTVNVTYYKRVPLNVNADGKVGVQNTNVNILNSSLPVTVSGTPTVALQSSTTVYVGNSQNAAIPVTLANGSINLGDVDITTPRKVSVCAKYEGVAQEWIEEQGGAHQWLSPWNHSDLTKGWFMTSLYVATASDKFNEMDDPFFFVTLVDADGSPIIFQNVYVKRAPDYQQVDFGEAGLWVQPEEDGEAVSVRFGRWISGEKVSIMAYGYVWDDGYTPQ